MIATRLRQISLLLIAMAISALAFIQMFQRTAGEFPMQYAGMLALVVVLFLVLWGLIVRFQPYASQSILPCVLLLTATGVTMIARIDQSEGWAVAQRQLIWLCIAIVLSALLIIFLKDYRVLRRFSYVSMVVGLVLLLAPMLPFVGQEVNGARIWIRIPGLGQFQPGEFAKLFLAFFFAAYLFDHRDQLAVAVRRCSVCSCRVSRISARSSWCGSPRWACSSCSMIWAPRLCSSPCSWPCCTRPPAVKAGSSSV